MCIRDRSQLQGAIYRLPESAGDEPCYVTADEYLSGNIRSKIASARLAAEKDEAFQINVSALEKAMPRDLDASEIEVRLGATWIPPRYIQQFMLEPVSYTHLDVYKRQHGGSCAGKRHRCVAGP